MTIVYNDNCIQKLLPMFNGLHTPTDKIIWINNKKCCIQQHHLTSSNNFYARWKFEHRYSKWSLRKTKEYYRILKSLYALVDNNKQNKDKQAFYYVSKIIQNIITITETTIATKEKALSEKMNVWRTNKLKNKLKKVSGGDFGSF